jgi:ribosome biogenesis protein UTP30
MALSKSVVAVGTVGSEPSLDQSQTLRASKALLSKIQSDAITQKTSGKPSLLDDADDEDAEDEIPVWMILTTKKHIIDKKRLKPGKILLPHPYLNVGDANLRICLITADPQRKYKDIVADPSFPTEISQRIQRVIDVKKLKAKYKPFEARRQLFGEYDVFLADDRVITLLPKILGKVFYKSGSKRPIPISLEGRRQDTDEQGNKRRKLSEGGTKVVKDEVKPASIARDIERTLSSALVHLAPSTTTAVKVGIASMTAEHVQENITAVVSDMVERYVPQKWRNLRAVHIKGPNTAALPIWLAEELWEDEQDVLEEPIATKGGSKKRTRSALESGDVDEGVIVVPGADGKMRRVEKPSTKRKSSEAEGSKSKKAKGDTDEAATIETEKKDKAARKAALQKQKSEAKAAAVKAR